MEVQICPTITATDLTQYIEQISRVKSFANRIHIDLMDGQFAPSKSPELKDIWLPRDVTCDIHLMYQRPMDQLARLVALKPHMVIIHNEADVHHMHFAAELHQYGILAGLALLQDTPVEWAKQIMHSFDQVLIFSGHLGYHGGRINLELLSKVSEIKQYHPDAEIAWDGGINETNAKKLVEAGVNVLNVGGYIDSAKDPKAAYAKIKEVI